MNHIALRTIVVLASTCFVALAFSRFSVLVPIDVQAQGTNDALLAKLVSRHQPQRVAFQFGLIGDTQYDAEQEEKFTNLMRAMNRERLRFVVHDGDIWSGTTPCNDERYRDRLETYNASRHPFIYTPGDNEWTDCWRAAAGEYDPLERLELLRQLFFANPSESLGMRRMPVTSQSEDPSFPLYRENLLWATGDVLFATVHVVGSNNNRDRTPEMDAEYEARNAANLAWIRATFNLARERSFAAVMIIMQANPRFDLTPPPSGFTDTLAVLESETIAFRQPVVLVHGDTHYFRIDKPLLGTKSRRRLENFTRLETFATSDVHWVRARVVPGDPNFFRLEQGIVVENLVEH